MAKIKTKKEDNLHEIPLRITDTTLRDSHQSLWATRMRTKDIVDIIETIDSVGYYSLEVWGGATFDVCMRFLRENPWERLREIKKRAKKTPLQMLLRGQNLVGYKNYADDLLERFIALAIENGMDIFRIFDALNDPRNLEAAIRAVKKYGGHAQGTLSYTISPVHTVEKYVESAKQQVEIGIDSLCIKDMAGILSPIAAEKLISALVKEIDVPIQMHCHASSGMGTATYVEGVRAGAGAIDCAISTMAGFSSQPPVETLVSIFKETNYSADLNVDALRKISKYFEKLYPKRAKAPGFRSIIDPEVLIHQIPGGMISNFKGQLTQQGALDRLPEVLEEVTKVRKDLGYPPLVTPASQFVGTMAVLNILSGERYKVVPNEIKDYFRGLYGRSPAPVNEELAKKILGDEKPIDHRPADDIEPMLPKATHDLEPEHIENEEDIVSYCILPEVALTYFKWRNAPEKDRDPIPADVEEQKNKQEPIKKETPAPKPKVIEPILKPDDYKGIGEILNSAGNINLDEISIRKGDFNITFKGASGNSSPEMVNTVPKQESIVPIQQEEVKKAEMVEKEEVPQKDEEEYSNSIKAPFVGTFYFSASPGTPPLAEEGQTVDEGTPVCIIEAMKLFNEIKVPVSCKILKFLVKDGEMVEKDQPIVAIEEM